MPDSKIKPNILPKPKPKPQVYGMPLFIYTGGGRDELSTTATTFQGIKIPPSQMVSVTQTVRATVQFVAECRVTDGAQLMLRIGRTNPGNLPCLDSTVVVTTGTQYETRYHMAGFGLPPGDHELFVEWCVSGGTGYIRYRYFTVILTT